jgi:hypothetical protein
MWRRKLKYSSFELKPSRKFTLTPDKVRALPTRTGGFYTFTARCIKGANAKTSVKTQINDRISPKFDRSNVLGVGVHLMRRQLK